MSEIPMVPMAQWVGQQGSEALATGSNPWNYLEIFTLSLQYRFMRNVYFHVLSKNFSVEFCSVLHKWRIGHFVGTLLILFLLIFPKSESTFYFFPNCFPRNNIIEHLGAGCVKQKQLLSNTKRSSYEKIWICETKNLWRENIIPSFKHEIIRY